MDSWLPQDVVQHPSLQALGSSISAVSFNPNHESCYFANSLGDIVHFDHERRHVYSYFRAHSSPIISLLGHQNDVLSLSQNKFTIHTQGGLLKSQWTCKNLLAMTMTKMMPSSLFLSSEESLYYYSLRSNQLISNISLHSPGNCIAAASNCVFVGHESGGISVIDLREGSVIATMESHAGGVSSLAIQDQMLASSGYSYKQGNLVTDNSVRLYDVRTMKMVMPVTVPLGASSVKIVDNVIYAFSSLSHQILSVDTNANPPSKKSIPLSQSDELVCFDVSPSKNIFAVGSATGSVTFWADKSGSKVHNQTCSPLQYPGEEITHNNSPSEQQDRKFSDYLGSGKYWARAKPVFDASMFQKSNKQLAEPLFIKNEKGLLPNTVNIIGIDQNISSDLFGIANFDGDVPAPYWNQIIRSLRNLNPIYNFVIQHCNDVCKREHCMICELALLFRSLDFSANSPIHIQNFLKCLKKIRPDFVASSVTISSFEHISQCIEFIIQSMDNFTITSCRICSTSKSKTRKFPFLIHINKIAVSLTKTLQQAAEASFKPREWCDECEGYRDFELDSSCFKRGVFFIFSVEPSSYRAHHLIERDLKLRKGKESLTLHLKSLLLESHSSQNLHLKCNTKLNGDWISCKNEFIMHESEENISKSRPIFLLYDSESGISKDKLEIPQEMSHLKGSLIGLDAEYVFYEKVQMEFRSDGSQLIIKPKKARLARLSLVNASDESVILDEYVSLSPDEVILDYSTHVSGIRPEDLVPESSTKTLSSRKNLLLKLQSLIDANCIIIGHGLENDFRVCNLTIPHDNYLDTVELFHLKNNRSISLKFLAWFFLQEEIQSGEHDSVIDARSAIRLYGHYQKLSSEGPGVLKKAIKDLYNMGYRIQFQVPTNQPIEK